jgi:hypothetical protein
MGNKKNTPVGRSTNMKGGEKNNAPAGGKLGKLHGAGKTIPTFNAGRIDKLEGTNPKSTGGVKS